MLADPGRMMFLIGTMGMVAQGLAAWWWFKVSFHDFSDTASDAVKELREMGRLSARAAVAQGVASMSAIVIWLSGAYVFQG